MNVVRVRYEGQDSDPRPPSGLNDNLNLLGIYAGITVPRPRV